MYPYRAFICYTHEDQKVAAAIEKALKDLGLVPFLDRKLPYGRDYFKQLRESIQSAHLFIPVITKQTLHHPWVHQEIGFAEALNIPILPIGIGTDPSGLIEKVQAVSVTEDLKNLVRELTKVDIDGIVRDTAALHRMLIETAVEAIDRPRAMQQHAQKVLATAIRKGAGMVRQRAYYTSFSVPDRGLDDPIWPKRDIGQLRSRSYLEAQRRERQEMEKLARLHGCRLIVDPRRDRFPGPLVAWRVRLEVLRDFIADETIDVQAMPARLVEPHNVVLAGDYFLAEADSRLAGEGYRRTQFTWHAPTVLDRIARFEEEFADLCKRNRCGAADSRRFTVEAIDRHLAEHPDEAAAPAG